MEFAIERDDLGRLVGTLAEVGQQARVTASNPDAAEALLAALDDTRADGLGECLWDEQGGDYWWMLRRDADQLTVVVLWSSGTLTGWQHVFRGECSFETFDRQVRAAIGALTARV